MGILDEAIREHLELKRKHGAEQEELRQLENEAFGPAPRAEEAAAPPAGEDQPQTGAVEGSESPGQTTREVIAQQPTEVFDVASELARHEPGDEADVEAEVRDVEAEAAPEPEAEQSAVTEAATELMEVEAADDEAEEREGEFSSATSDTEAVLEQPAVVTPAEDEGEPVPESEAEPTSEEEPLPEVFDEQALSEELEQALEGPISSEDRRTAFFEETDEFQAPPQRPSRQPDPAPETHEQDLLDETPDFLEETPEHDRLWFEQKPPKDFDFND